MYQHGGTNNSFKYDGTLSDQTARDIAKKVLDMGESCREFGVYDISFSGITIRRNGWEGEVKRREINPLLRSGCRERGYTYIGNENISVSDIENKPRDKVHLLESGSIKLANNILRVLNAKP